MSNQLSQSKNSENKNGVNIGKTDSGEPSLERDVRKTNTLVKEFDNFTFQPRYNENNYVSNSPLASFTPKRPNPLIKQNSLPPFFKTHTKSESFGSGQYHPLIANKHKSDDSIFTVYNNSKTNYISDDEWVDQFGIELEQPKSYSSGPSSPRPSFSENQSPQTSPRTVIPSLTKVRPSEQYQSNSNNNSPRSNTTPNGSIKHSSRIISVQNAYKYNNDELLARQFKNFEVRSIKRVGDILLVSFFDVRESVKALQNLFGKIINGIPLELSFFLLRDFSCPEEYNQGTLVIFNLDPNIEEDKIKKIFGAFGKIREVRESPNKKHKFVEFYDVRDAERAMKYLNKKEIGGRRIKIEPSRPGGGKQENKNSNSTNKPISSSMPSQTSLSSYFNQDLDLRKNTEQKIDINPRKEPKTWNYNDLSITTDGISNSQNPVSMESSETDKYAINLGAILSDQDKRTTLMIKNIPNKYDQDMLLNAINNRLSGTYDFFYLPIDFKNRCNVGYAFINFIDPLSIPTFYEEFNNKKWEKFNSEKVCEIKYARIQGKDAMIEHFKNSSILYEDPKCRPLIFKSDGLGIPQPFPVGPYVKQWKNKK